MKNIKSKLAMILVFMLAIPSIMVSADDNLKEVKEVHEFTVQQAVEYALENLNSIKQLDMQIEKQEDVLENKEEEQENTKYSASFYAPIQSSVQSLLTEEGYYKEQQRIAVEELKMSKENIIENIKMGVESSYFNLVNSEANLKVEKENLDRAQKEFDIVNTKFGLGNVTKMDVLTAEMQLERAQTNYQNSIDNHKYQMMNFNKSIGLPLKEEVVLTEQLTYEAIGEIDIDAEITEALTNSYDYLKAKNSKELMEMQRDIVGKIYTSNTTYYKSMEDAVTMAEYNLEDTENNITLRVTKAYMDITKAERSLKTLENSIELSKQAYEISKLSYEAGLNTALDVSKSRTSLNEAELGYNQALLGYNLSVKAFEMSKK